jgi:Tfp pilus assembly protein PilO
MRVISLQKKLFIFISSIVLAVALISFLIVLPSLRQISELKRSINATEEFIEQQYLRTQHTKKSIRHLSEVLVQTEKFYNAVLKKEEELKIITQLEGLAAKNKIDQKIDLQFIEPVAENEKTSVKKQPFDLPYYQISFSNTGEFQNLVAFLQDLEGLDYYLIIDSLQWGSPSAKREENLSGINVKFNAITYATEKK